MTRRRSAHARILEDRDLREAAQDLIRQGWFDDAWQERARAQAWTPPPLPEDLLGEDELETLRRMRGFYRGGCAVRP